MREGWTPNSPLSKYIYLYDIKDHLGNVRLVHDDSEQAKIYQGNYYSAFGVSILSLGDNMTPTQTVLSNDRLYNGKELQDGTNWLDYGARMYYPELGRWMAVDPLPDTGGQESWSTYQYVFNNPAKLTDPDGRCPVCPLVIPLLPEIGAAVTVLGEMIGGALIGGATGTALHGLSQGNTGGGAYSPAVGFAMSTMKPGELTGGHILQSSSASGNGQNNTTPGTRRQNRIPDTGTPNSTATNSSGTTTKKYGPDGNVQKEFNKGHHGPNVPKNERTDHVHDHQPKPNRHPNDPKPTERHTGRPPKKGELLKDFGL